MTTDMPQISVIVPVYNVEKYLRKCIDSLINQKFDDYEIILVNDGSSDSSGIICDEYNKKYDNISVIHKNNGGLSDARNRGVERSTGRYIIFVDSDDYVDDDYVSTLYQAIMKSKARVAFSLIKKEYIEDVQALATTNSRGISFEVLSQQEAQEIILRGEPVGTSACAKIYDKDLCVAHPFPRGKLMEDLATIYHILQDIDKVGYVNNKSYHYIQRPGSIMHSEYDYSTAREFINLALHYIENATTEEIRKAAIARLIYVSGVVAQNASSKEKSGIYSLISSHCRKYWAYVRKDKKLSIQQKIKSFLLCNSKLGISLYVVLESKRKN